MFSKFLHKDLNISMLFLSFLGDISFLFIISSILKDQSVFEKFLGHAFHLTSNSENQMHQFLIEARPLLVSSINLGMTLIIIFLLGIYLLYFYKKTEAIFKYIVIMNRLGLFTLPLLGLLGLATSVNLATGFIPLSLVYVKNFQIIKELKNKK